MTSHKPTYQDKIRTSLQDPGTVADISTYIIDFYRAANYKERDRKGCLPEFLENAVGLPLLHLSTFGPRSLPSENKGLGKAINTAHGEMLSLAWRMANFAMGSDVSEIVKEGGLRALLELTRNKHIDVPLPAHATCIVPKGFLEELMLMGGFSTGLVRRTSYEKSEMEQRLGTAEALFYKMLSIRNEFKKYLEAAHIDVPERFSLDHAKIQRGFINEKKQVRNSRVFIYAAHMGIMSQEMRTICQWPATGITLETPADAASALFALSYFTGPFEGKDHLCQKAFEQSQQIAEAPGNQEAVAILNSESVRQTLQALQGHADLPAREKTMKNLAEELANYCSRAHSPTTHHRKPDESEQGGPRL